jgi:predicted metal-dependent hydrolase
MTDITVRYLKFDLEEHKALNVEIIPGEIEMSYLMVALSIILPYIEPYIIKHSKAGQKIITDPGLLQDMRQFSQQEGQHYRQHALFNARVRKKFPELETLEKKVKADYERFSQRGLKFNLAFAEGFESLTNPFVIFMWNSGMIKEMRGPLADMYAWHFLEEMEHRTVAYDVYYHLYGSYGYRFWVSLIAQSHLLTFMFSCTRLMLHLERDQFQARGGWSGRISRIWKWTKLAGKYLLPQLGRTYLPGYNPRNLIIPQEVTNLAEHYNARAYKLVNK